MLRVENLADPGERIDLGDGFVWAQTHYTRETQGKAAFVAIRTLNIVEGDLEDDGGLNVALEAAVFGSVFQKILR